MTTYPKRRLALIILATRQDQSVSAAPIPGSVIFRRFISAAMNSPRNPVTHRRRCG
jgi:hypothetical protein